MNVIQNLFTSLQNMVIKFRHTALYLSDSKREYTQLVNLTLLLPVLALHGV